MTRKATKTGKQLERWVANAYREMGARRVEHDVELAGNQIDVYVELETPGHLLHRIAVEAKDRTCTVGIGVVNDFAIIVDLLRSGGLIDEGVVVSASGFSKQARNAAREYNIRLLEPTDLTVMVAEEKATRLITSPSPVVPGGPSVPQSGESEQQQSVVEERTQLKQLLDKHRCNLHKPREEAGIYGAGGVPLCLHSQIEPEEETIAEIKTRMDSVPVAEGGKERKSAKHTSRPQRGCSLEAKIVVALIALFGVVFSVVFTPVWERLVDMFLPAPTPIVVTEATPTPTATPPTPSVPAQTLTPPSPPTSMRTSPCSVHTDNAIGYQNGGALLITVRGADPTRPDAVKITFENPYPKSFSSWVVPLDTCDATGSESLSFLVRGEKGEEQFMVGIKDFHTNSGDEPKVGRTASTDWQRVSISLEELLTLKWQDLSALENLSLGFTCALGSGTIYVDGFIIGPP